MLLVWAYRRTVVVNYVYCNACMFRIEQTSKGAGTKFIRRETQKGRCTHAKSPIQADATVVTFSFMSLFAIMPVDGRSYMLIEDYTITSYCKASISLTHCN